MKIVLILHILLISCASKKPCEIMKGFEVKEVAKDTFVATDKIFFHTNIFITKTKKSCCCKELIYCFPRENL